MQAAEANNRPIPLGPLLASGELLNPSVHEVSASETITVTSREEAQATTLIPVHSQTALFSVAVAWTGSPTPGQWDKGIHRPDFLRWARIPRAEEEHLRTGSRL